MLSVSSAVIKLYSSILTISNPFSRCNHVIAVDIDPQKIECAHHNASIYGVNDHIDFIVGDFINIAPRLKVVSYFLKLCLIISSTLTFVAASYKGEPEDLLSLFGLVGYINQAKCFL